MKKNVNDIPYLKILKNAFVLTWKNRYLWWFGLFTFLSNIGGYNYWHNNTDKNHPPQLTDLQNLSPYAHWILLGTFILLLFFISVAILSIISRGALISSLDRLQKNKATNFKTGFQKGRKSFGKVFLIALFSGLFVLVAALILAPPVVFLFLNHNYFLGGIMAVLAVAIFLPLIILISYLRTFGYLYAILGGLRPRAALENAYTLFQKNISLSLIMAILFIPINILLFLLIILALIPIAIAVSPLALILFIFAGTIGAEAAGILGLVLLALLILLLRSFMEVFAQAAWILFFYEIASPKEKEVATEPIAEIESLPENSLPTISTEKE